MPQKGAGSGEHAQAGCISRTFRFLLPLSFLHHQSASALSIPGLAMRKLCARKSSALALAPTSQCQYQLVGELVHPIGSLPAAQLCVAAAHVKSVSRALHIRQEAARHMLRDCSNTIMSSVSEQRFVVHAEAVKLLLQHGAAPSHCSSAGDFALRAAAATGDAECVCHLLDAGADPNQTSQQRGSALLAASMQVCIGAHIFTAINAPGSCRVCVKTFP